MDSLYQRQPPSVIEVMLKCYYMAYPEFAPTPAIDSALHWLCNAGLIIFKDSYWGTTKKGSAWVDMICHTPLPQKREEWFDPRTNESINRL